MPAHIGIKGNGEADKTAKQSIDMPGKTTTRLPYTDYNLTIRRARNSELQRKWENRTSKLHYITPRIKKWKCAYNSCRQYKVKQSMIRNGHTSFSHWHLISSNEQQPACINAACGNQSLTIKHCIQNCPNGGKMSYNKLYLIVP